MRYFSPSYWFKMWVLSAPLFNYKNEGIYAKSIDNQNIKDWTSNNTNLELIENQTPNLSNGQTIQFQNNENIPSSKNLENDDFYENFLKTQGWSNNPEIAQKQLIEIQEEHHNFLEKQHEKTIKRHKNVIKREEPTRIFDYTIMFELIEDNPVAFFNELTLLTRNLVNNNILVDVNDVNDNENDNLAYTINQNSQYNYFSINVNINNQNGNRRLRLFFRSSDLYLQGYISDNSNRYSYFSDSTLTNPNIENVESSPLSFSGSYTSLRQNENYSWQTIYNDFYTLANPSSTDNQIRQSSTGVILGTSESLRFYEVGQALIRSQGYLYLDPYTSFNIQNIDTNPASWTNFFQPIVLNWQTWTNTAIRYLQEGGDLNNWYIGLFNNNQRQYAIRIFMISMFHQIHQCPNRSKRDIDNNKVCYENKANPCQYKNYFINKNKELYSINCNSSEIKKVNINGKINAIRILNENTKGNLKAGDIYVGTDKGLYLIQDNGVVFKEYNINDEEVTSIKKFNKDDFYATTKNGDVYFLRTDKVASYGHLIAEKLNNLESSDLNKEIQVYYNENKNNVRYNFYPTLHNYYNTNYNIINLGKINPVDNYKKLQVFGDTSNDCWGTMVNWGDWVYTDLCKPSWGSTYKNKGDSIDIFLLGNHNNFHNLIENTKNQVSPNYEHKLQYFDDQDGAAQITVNQRFGLTWYWENDNYFLKVWTLQYCEWWASEARFDCNIKIGSGIRLYNDDEDIRIKREAFEAKNKTKWTDDFTKSINYEQHLPIDNKTNFVTSNITSL